MAQDKGSGLDAENTRHHALCLWHGIASVRFSSRYLWSCQGVLEALVSRAEGGSSWSASNKRRSAPLAAAEAGCDPIDVSLPGLLQYVPQLLCEGHHPLDWMLTYGKPLGFLRPHARLQVVAHTIATAQFVLPPAEFVLVGYARVLLPRPISTTNLYWFLVR